VNGVDGVDGGGINVDGVSGHGSCVCCADGVDEGNGGGIDVDGVGGHRVYKCGAYGVYRHVTGVGVDGRGCSAVAESNRAEAECLVDLCCPVEPRGFVQPRVKREVGCG